MAENYDKDTRELWVCGKDDNKTPICTRIEPASHRRKHLAFGLICAIFIGTFAATLLLTLPADDTITLHGIGFDAKFDFDVDVIDRYTTDSLYRPSTAAPPAIQTLYFEDFESGTGGWSNGVTQSAKKYEGKKSFRLQGTAGTEITAKTNPTGTTGFLVNQTSDIIFYTYLDGNFGASNGYVLFRVTTLWNGSNQAVATFVIVNSTIYTPGINETVVQMPAPMNQTWCGYLVMNLRTYLANGVNASILDTTYNITKVELVVNNFAQKVYIDAVEIQSVPSTVEPGVWKLATTPVTDFVVTVAYTVTIDTALIPDTSSFSIRIEFSNNITQVSTLTTHRRLVEVMNFSGMAFVSGVFTATTTGILHPFPKDDKVYGGALLYEFDAYVTAIGVLSDGRFTGDAANKTLPSLAFTINWVKPVVIT